MSDQDFVYSVDFHKQHGNGNWRISLKYWVAMLNEYYLYFHQIDISEANRHGNPFNQPMPNSIISALQYKSTNVGTGHEVPTNAQIHLKYLFHMAVINAICELVMLLRIPDESGCRIELQKRGFLLPNENFPIGAFHLRKFPQHVNPIEIVTTELLAQTAESLRAMRVYDSDEILLSNNLVAGLDVFFKQIEHQSIHRAPNPSSRFLVLKSRLFMLKYRGSIKFWEEMGYVVDYFLDAFWETLDRIRLYVTNGNGEASTWLRSSLLVGITLETLVQGPLEKLSREFECVSKSSTHLRKLLVSFMQDNLSLPVFEPGLKKVFEDDLSSVLKIVLRSQQLEF